MSELSDRFVLQTAMRDMISGYERLNRDYEKQNNALRFDLRFPMIVIMFPVAKTWRSFIQHNEKMIAFNRERIDHYKQQLGEHCSP